MILKIGQMNAEVIIVLWGSQIIISDMQLIYSSHVLYGGDGFK